MESPFDASMMTHSRERISAEMIQQINNPVFASRAVEAMDNPEEGGDTEDEEERPPHTAEDGGGNRETLILDATCCPADIHWLTDVGLLNHARELVEEMIDVLYLASRFPVSRTYRLPNTLHISRNALTPQDRRE